jgi:hypothetical protein
LIAKIRIKNETETFYLENILEYRIRSEQKGLMCSEDNLATIHSIRGKSPRNFRDLEA